MAELAHVYLGGGSIDVKPPFTIGTQSHLSDIPHAAVFNGEGTRLALFKGEDWDDAREAAEKWVQELTGESK